MNTDKNVLDRMKSDAFLAYLELCTTIGEVPRSDIYNQIKDCEDYQKLDSIISLIEAEHSKFENENPQKNK